MQQPPSANAVSMNDQCNQGADTDRNQGLIRPTRRRQDPALGPDALMVMIPSALKGLVREQAARRTALRDASLPEIHLSADTPPVTLAGPFLGAPQAVMGLEKLIALGARRLWALGWCGSLDPALRIGSLLIPSGAFGDEGTSRHYPIGRDPQPDPAMRAMLARALREAGLDFAEGAVWSTDAPYRETPAKVLEFQERGAAAVEMEMSALMTVALFRSVALAGLLVVSDELFELTWHPGFTNPLLLQRTRAAGRLLLDLARSTGPQPEEGGGKQPR